MQSVEVVLTTKRIGILISETGESSLTDLSLATRIRNKGLKIFAVLLIANVNLANVIEKAETQELLDESLPFQWEHGPLHFFDHLSTYHTAMGCPPSNSPK